MSLLTNRGRTRNGQSHGIRENNETHGGTVSLARLQRTLNSEFQSFVRLVNWWETYKYGKLWAQSVRVRLIGNHHSFQVPHATQTFVKTLIGKTITPPMSYCQQVPSVILTSEIVSPMCAFQFFLIAYLPFGPGQFCCKCVTRTLSHFHRDSCHRFGSVL
jgi:hypothetical protein